MTMLKKIRNFWKVYDQRTIESSTVLQAFNHPILKISLYVRLIKVTMQEFDMKLLLLLADGVKYFSFILYRIIMI